MNLFAKLFNLAAMRWNYFRKLALGTTDFVLAAPGGGYHPGVTRAVAEAFGRVSAWSGFWAVRKRNTAWVPVSFAGMTLELPPFASDDALVALKDKILEAAESNCEL